MLHRTGWPKWKNRQYSVRLFGLFLIAFFMMQSVGIVRLDLFDRLDDIAYDARTRLMMPERNFPGIVIVDIDEKSLAEEGRWPWPRDKVARLVDELFDRYQVIAAGFDIVFAEPDDSGLRILGKIEKKLDGHAERRVIESIRPELEYDKLLAQSLAGKPVVLGYYFDLGSHQHDSGMLPEPLFKGEAIKNSSTDFISASGYGANLPILQQAVTEGGDFNFIPDFDGITRRVPMLIEYGGNYYESLTLGLARAALGIDNVKPVIRRESSGYSAVESLEIGSLRIPLDEYACSLIPFRGGRGTFHYVSAADVLHGRTSPSVLEGKIVLVGTTAPGLLDLRSTPVGVGYPGIEAHANMLAGILTQSIKQSPPYLDAVNLTTLLVTGLLLIGLLPKLSPMKSVLLALIVLAAIVSGNLAAWKYGNFVIPLASPLLLTISLFALDTILGYFLETRAKKQISDLFGQYVPPRLVDEMSKNPDEFDMKSESREMTVMFSDIRDFTRISEGLDPETLSAIINEYLTAMTKIIYSHHGTVDKYIGDAIMAFWGAPVRNPDHAQDGIMAAIEMQEALKDLNQQFESKGWPKLRIGIGVNTGTMNVGNMGSAFRKAYTVMGDSVNLASRLEGLTKYYGVGILLGEDAVRASKGIVYEEIDRVMVKGRLEPLAIFQPLGLEGEVSLADLDEAQRFEKALLCYRKKDWENSQAMLQALLHSHPEKLLYSLYLERISSFIDHPPPEDWNGVYAFQTK